MGTEATGYDVPVGTYEDAKAMVGKMTPVRFGEIAVSAPMIRHYAAMVQDGNAAYWDDDFAEQHWGGVVAPPGMLMTWLIPLEWKPDGGRPVPLLTARVPLPGNTFVNVSNDAEHFAPIRVGDHLNVVEELVDVSGAKRTSLGTGHFVTTVSTYRRQDGELVARATNVLYRFSPPEAERRRGPGPERPGEAPRAGDTATKPERPGAGGAKSGKHRRTRGRSMIPGVSYAQRYWEDVEEGSALPRVEDEISYRRVIMNPATTWDYFPGHHDPEYARSQGQPTIYVNTMHFLGFVDRLATEWGGPRSFIARRKVSMQRSIYAGDTMVGEGRVVRRYIDDAGGRVRYLVDLELAVKNQDDELCCPASVTLELPVREPREPR